MSEPTKKVNQPALHLKDVSSLTEDPLFGKMKAVVQLGADLAADRQEIERLKSDLEDARKGLTPFPHEFAERLNRMFSEPGAEPAPPPIAELKQLAAQNPPPQEWFDDDAESATAGVPSEVFVVEPQKWHGAPQWTIRKEDEGNRIDFVAWCWTEIPAKEYAAFLNNDSPLHRENAELREQLKQQADEWRAVVNEIGSIAAAIHASACVLETSGRPFNPGDKVVIVLKKLRECLAVCEVQVNNLEVSRD